MLDSPPVEQQSMTPKDKCLNNEDMPTREKNEHNNENEVIADSTKNEETNNEQVISSSTNNNHDDNDDEQLSRQNGDMSNESISANAGVASEDEDAETVELSRLRCTSVRTEVIADREKQRQKRKNRCADYPGLAFGSAAFGSETMMKFNIIKNELHNIMRSQLKRVDGEVAALSQRIKALDENLAKSEQYIKTATAALADAVAMEVERRKNAGEDEYDSINDANDPLSQFDAQMSILEGKLLEAKYLAAKATNNQNHTPRVTSSHQGSEEAEPEAEIKKTPPKPTTLRRPFPTK